MFDIIARLVIWENINNQDVLNEAKTEILKSTNGTPPPLLDPFAGGGSIPLEAQRLGLESHAGDLNPVAVMINKAMIEIPPRYAGMAPVNPDARASIGGSEAWSGAQGLAEDVRYYGEWIKKEAFKRIGHLYPTIDGKTVISWLWTRTVKCPNPACGYEMPLANSFYLSKKVGKKAYVQPIIDTLNKRITYSVKTDNGPVPDPPKLSRGAKFKCICCDQVVPDEHIRVEGVAGRMGARLMAIVADGNGGRLFYSPSDEHIKTSTLGSPIDPPREQLPYDPRNIWCVNYGLDSYDKLFTHRQLVALTTFTQLVNEARMQIVADGGSVDYAHSIGVYLGFLVDKLADRNSSICQWMNATLDIRPIFARQAIPMSWETAEANPFSNSVGCWSNAIDWVEKCIRILPAAGFGSVIQSDSRIDNNYREVMVSTDPPYYDNISYADLSDFYYVWLRQSQKQTYPDVFRTVLVPKSGELVASPYRNEEGFQNAKDYFECGMLSAFKQIHKYSCQDYPVTVYYAFKQSESESHGVASTGWETMLTAIIQAGFSITGTWPVRTERGGRPNSHDTNALASSIVLVCRKRPADAPICTRRDFIKTLKRELKPALQKLQRSNIAPVDMAQSAIGPGMAVYSRFSQVLEADGSPMSVRSALQIINQELDIFFNEQDSELERDSRFCVDLYSQSAFNDMKFGDADILARAKNTSVAALVSRGILYAQKGIVHLLGRDEIPTNVHSNEKVIWLLTQQLTRAIETGGVAACAEIIAPMYGYNVEQAKSLAYRLYTIAERKGWAQEAYAYNSLVIAWPEIQSRAAEMRAIKPEQGTLFDTTETD